MPDVRGFRDMHTPRPATTVVDPGKSPQRPVGACIVRAAEEGDVAPADAVLRAAFDAHTGQPDRLGNAEYLRNRWRTEAGRVVVAEVSGKIVGSNVITSWGSVGWFGPLSVAPSLWRQGIADALVAAAHERLQQRGAAQFGLFTFSDSPLHFRLYARHGYWPGALVLITSRALPDEPHVVPTSYGSLPEAHQASVLDDLRELTDQVHPGWDISGEVVATSACGQGDTVIVHHEGRLCAAAICQVGPGSEAATGTCRVKVAVARPGPDVERHMTHVLAAVDALAAQHGAPEVIAAVSTANEACTRFVLGRGHRVMSQGVAMHWGGSAYRRADVWALDDWR
jgi:predicted N-acetyltransferase YhbS